MTLRELAWDFVHQCVAHPALFFTREAPWAVRLHDATEPFPQARIEWSGQVGAGAGAGAGEGSGERA